MSELRRYIYMIIYGYFVEHAQKTALVTFIYLFIYLINKRNQNRRYLARHSNCTHWCK